MKAMDEVLQRSWEEDSIAVDEDDLEPPTFETFSNGAWKRYTLLDEVFGTIPQHEEQGAGDDCEMDFGNVVEVSPHAHVEVSPLENVEVSPTHALSFHTCSRTPRCFRRCHPIMIKSFKAGWQREN